MATQNVVLVDKTGTIKQSDLVAVAAAVTIQVNRDLKQYWPVDALVTALPRHATVPAAAWPVYIGADLPPGLIGVHLTDHGTPYTYVEMGHAWPLTTSHEVCEMLVDPTLHRTIAAPAIRVVNGVVQDAPGTFNYLVEICDPSGSPDHGYVINNVPVSDFCTPRFFDAAPSAGARYSFTKALKAPRRVLRDGYMIWHDPVRDIDQQVDWVNYPVPTIVTLDLGLLEKQLSREHVDAHMGTSKTISATHRDHPLLKRARGEAH